MKGKDNKEQCKDTEGGNCDFWGSATQLGTVVKTGFIKIGNGGANKEDGNVDPIGGFSYDAVVGVKQRWNEDQSQKNTA